MEKTTESQTLKKLTDELHLVETRMEKLLSKILENPNPKLDFLFTKYTELYSHIADQIASMKEDVSEPHVISPLWALVKNIENELYHTNKAKKTANFSLSSEDVEKLNQQKAYWETAFKNAQYDKDFNSDIEIGPLPVIKAIPMKECRDQSDALKGIWRSERQNMKPVKNDTVRKLTKKIMAAAGKEQELDAIKKEIEEVRVHPTDAQAMYELISRVRFTERPSHSENDINRDALQARIAHLEQSIESLEQQTDLAREKRDDLRKELYLMTGDDPSKVKLAAEVPSVNPEPAVKMTYNSSSGNNFCDKNTINPIDEKRETINSKEDAKNNVPSAKDSALEFMLRAGISKSKAKELIEEGRRNLNCKYQDEATTKEVSKTKTPLREPVFKRISNEPDPEKKRRIPSSRIPKRLIDLERQFDEAASQVSKAFGIPLTYSKSGKRAVSDFSKHFVPFTEISDSEIMILANLLTQESQAAESIKVEKQKLTLLGKLKKVVSSVVTKMKLSR